MNRQALELQANELEWALTVHDAPGRVTGGTVTPRWVRFQVWPAPGVRVERVRGLSEDLARVLAVPSVRVARRGAAVTVEVPRGDPQPVRLVPLLKQIDGKMPAVTACLGLEENGMPLLIRLPSPDVAHVLVAGMTGSGKTVLLRAMVLSLALMHRRAQLALVLVDPRGGQAFDCFGGLPHLVRPVIRDVGEAAEVLGSLVRLMEIRDAEGVTIPPVVVFIDELADLLLTGGDPVSEALTRLLQRGRGPGLHVVAATQKPTAAVIGTLIKANFPVRLVGRVASPEDAKVAAGWRGTGAERLQGRGDFLAVAEGRVTRFQAAFVGQEEIDRIMRERGWECAARQTLAISERDKGNNREPQDLPVMVELPPAPEPGPGSVEKLMERLAGMGWNCDESYRSACRALGMHEGGAEFLQVKAAVDRLREGGAGAIAMLQEKETRNGERSDVNGVLAGSNSNSNPWLAMIEAWEAGDV